MRHARLGGAGLAALLLIAVWLAGAAAVAQTATAPVPRVTARLKVAGKTLNVILTRMQGDKVYFAYEEDPRAETAVKVKDVQSAWFKLEYDREAVGQATAKKDLSLAARILYGGVAPALPFLVLPKNNGVALAIQTGTCFMRAATVKSRCGVTPADRKLAEPEYKTAEYILDKAAVAAWSEDVESARLRALLCRVLLDRLDDAQTQLSGIGVPGRSDDAVGLYWLVCGRLAFAKGNFREALGYTVQSIGLETKDLDTFPDALLLSGLCYEKMENPYRARDVYYEVASLFQRTPWAEVALPRLQAIMTAGTTRGKEPTPIANIFFASEEDVNAKVTEFLAAGGRAPAKPDGKTTVDKKDGTDKKGGKADPKPPVKPEEKKDK